MKDKKSGSGYYRVDKQENRFGFTRNVNGVQVTVHMPEQHSPEQEKALKEQIIELIGGRVHEKNRNT